MDDAIDTYLLDCSARLSPQTLRWYTEKLWAFAAWAKQEEATDLASIRQPTINRYLLHLQRQPSERTGKPLTNHTLHGYIQVVTSFLRWCNANEYGVTIPARGYAMPKVTQKVIETFSPTQLKALIAACAREETEWLGQRDRAILYTLLDTGIRASELVGLELSGLHLNEGYLRVLGKGSKEREVGFGTNTKYHLIKYLRRYRKAAEGVETVFINKRREPMTVSGLDQMLYRLGEWAGIEGVRCSAHTFRHTYAVNFLLGGGDMYALSRSLGHTSVSTTEIYVRASKDRDLRRVNASVADKLLTR